jgi:dolichyl-phosphate beta-glucosyltransferase
MSEANGAPFLSIVIPAFNEAARLGESLDAMESYLARQPYAAEVLVVDDGSTDGTADLVRARAETWTALRLVEGPHRGKGHAVKVGLLATTGEYTFLCDADLSMPIAELAKFLPEGMDGCDVAIASREGPGAHRYGEPLYRHVMGRVFNAFVRWTLLAGIQDSQCGFKCLRGDLARRLAELQTVEGWGFDVELLCVARLWGRRIVEVPIDWYFSPSSRINPLSDSWRMVREVLAVRRNALSGRYAARRPEALALAPGSSARGRAK